MTVALRLYLDECVDYRLVALARGLGHDVAHVAETTARGLSDEDQLESATAADRILVSHNQLDFRRLHQAWQGQGRPHAGIALIPQTTPAARLTVRFRLMLEWIASEGDPTSRIFTWHELQQRLTSEWRLPGWIDAEIRSAMAWD